MALHLRQSSDGGYGLIRFRLLLPADAVNQFDAIRNEISAFVLVDTTHCL